MGTGKELFGDISVPPSEQTHLELCGFAGQFVCREDGGMAVVTHRTIDGTFGALVGVLLVQLTTIQQLFIPAF